MDDMDILREMIRNTALVSLQHEYGKPLVKLCEPQAPDSIAIIRSVPADALVIRVDAFLSPDSVFSGRKGECKRADFIIISAEKIVLSTLR